MDYLEEYRNDLPFYGGKGSSSLSLAKDFPRPWGHRLLARFPYKVWSPSDRISLKSSHKVIGFTIELYHYCTSGHTLHGLVSYVIHRAHNWLLMTPTNRSLHRSSLPIFHITWLDLFHWDTNSKSTSDDCPSSISISLEGSWIFLGNSNVQTDMRTVCEEKDFAENLQVPHVKILYQFLVPECKNIREL